MMYFKVMNEHAEFCNDLFNYGRFEKFERS